MIAFRAMLAAAGLSMGGGGVNWSNYNATNDKTPVEFSSSSVAFVKVVKIDDTRALVVYRGASFQCKARIATINASGIVSFGTEATVLAAVITDSAVCLLDSTHAVVAVESGSAVKTIVIEFSGGTISTVGTAVNTESVNSQHLEVCALSSTDFITTYYNGTVCRVFYASVSGTTITMGNGIDALTASIISLDIAMLTSTTAVITIGRTGPDDWTALLVSYSGTTPAVDDTLSVLDGAYSVGACSVRQLSSTSVIATCAESTGTECLAVVISESGGSLSAGTIVSFDSETGEYTSIALPDLAHAVCTIGVSETSMRTTVIEISGASLTPLTTYTNDTADREYIHSTEVGEEFVMVCYEDDNDSSRGKAKILTV